MKRHDIGGSVFVSSRPEILKPIPFRDGVLLVVPDYTADTHHLTFNGNIIASHPNGFSCHCLAERMVAGHSIRIHEQSTYIVACGGFADFNSINSLTNIQTPIK